MKCRTWRQLGTASRDGQERRRSLQVWQATIASGIARAITSRKRPSAKQTAQGESVFEEAIKKGFRPAMLQST